MEVCLGRQVKQKLKGEVICVTKHNAYEEYGGSGVLPSIIAT
jgi:hypothetical protein